MGIYIFGYGSLISRDSREKTGTTGKSFAARVNGLKRSWNVIIPEGKTVALGLERKEGIDCNGIFFEVSEEELLNFDKREGNSYSRERLLSQNIENFEKLGIIDFEAWVYLIKKKGHPSEDFQIHQSYVDVILTGCLEEGDEFAKEFMATTSGWDFIDDDRESPKYPRFLKRVDKKKEIDKLLLGI